MLQRTHTCSGPNPPRLCRTQERWRGEFDRDAGIYRRFELAHLLPIEECDGLPTPAGQEIGSAPGLQAEGDFSAPASASWRGFGGRPPRRSTSPVTMSNAPAAKFAWMLTTVLTAPRRQARLRQSGAQLLFRDDTERKRPAGDFGDQGRSSVRVIAKTSCPPGR
jgi:hypothetical protein